MSRTISVHDHITGVTAAMTVDDQRITELRFIAAGDSSLAVDDLYLIESFGLKLHAPSRKTPTPDQPAKPKPVTAKPAAKAKRPRQKARGIPRPDDETLVRLWHEHDRTLAFIAREIGCSGQTVANWIAAARERGVDLPAKQK